MENVQNASVLVLMSTYNGEKYLQEQLDSIFSQENVNVDILIRDDGSTDSTISLIQNAVQSHPNRVFLIQGSNVGYARSFTKLLEVAEKKYSQYDYYAFSDQDDVWEPQKVFSAIQLLKLQLDKIPVTYCSNTKLVDTNLNFIRYAWKNKDVHLNKERALIQNFAIGCTMVFNKKAVELYTSHLPRIIKRHDFLMYQLCTFLGKVIYENNSYIKYRQHGNNQIGRPNFWGRMKIRRKGHYKERVLECQNKYFLEAYKDLLSVEDIGLISHFVFYRKNIFMRLSLLFDKRIKYHDFEADVFFIIKILLGRI